ncbi:H-NS histone family protein [Pukyongiella litopenaei]|uniref:H-NS histone family protein n=2 Tax=Pukyongiella litopenaei TaxID=2605946 RepID=A0A2S0MQG0_9RHOB|nr:H-NS histone family protein [Pukyongiella litopenaei]
MTIDLQKMSKTEPEKLKGDIDKALVAAELRNRKDALKAIKQTAAEYGCDLDQLLGDAKPAGKPRKLPPKYRHPDDPSRTWTGRGRRPQWIVDALDAGADLADLLI